MAQVAIITASDSGIGKECALLLAQHDGARTPFNARAFAAFCQRKIPQTLCFACGQTAAPR